MAAGFEKSAIKRALGRYCNRPLYRGALQAGAVRMDLQGQAGGVVSEDEVRTAPRRPRRNPSSTAKAALLANATPLLKESLVAGRLELTVKFSKLPQPLPVQGGLKIGVQTQEGTVTAIRPAKVWKKFEQAAQTYSHGVAALIGPARIFTLETQIYPKPTQGKPEIVYDGARITLAGHVPDRDPMVQGKAQAHGLQNVLRESTGPRFEVQPVVLYPGGFVKTTAQWNGDAPWILNPKAWPAFLEHRPTPLSHADAPLATDHLSRFIRTAAK